MSDKISGWLILDKPEGITSAKAVSIVKKLLGGPKIGHAGTLDPFASGILPLALNEATKVMQFAVQTEKEYVFEVEFGERRDTDDREGKVVNSGGRIPSKEEIEKAIPDFIGEIDQVPPQYSAIKVDGKRSYDLAREGKGVDLKPRKVIVHSLELLSYGAPFCSFKMHCGKGTYVRSIAKDLAYKLGTYAYVKTLRRIRVGKFSLAQAISLESLKDLVHIAPLNWLLPVGSVLDDIPVLNLEKPLADRLKFGQAIRPPENFNSEIIVVKSCGALVAICKLEEDSLKPVRVFNL